MADPIEAHYTPDGDDWTVAVTGRGRTLTGRAPGLIAARDRADQLVEQLTPEEPGRKTVVHLLNGDAVEFTTAYLTARLARTEEPAPVEPSAERPDGDTPAAQDEQAAPEADTAGDADSPEAADDSPGMRGPIGAVLDAQSGAADGPPVAAKPTPRPRSTAQPAHAAPATEEETAPSGG